MKHFRDELEEMEYQKYKVDYFFDLDKYCKREGNIDAHNLSDGGAILANLAWFSFPAIDLLISDLPNNQVQTALYKSGFYTHSTDMLLPDVKSNREELAEYMRRGPIAFANSMKAWPGSRAFELYKHFGDAWFDTMAARALLASDYLGHESSPVKRDASGRVKPSGVATGNVIKVNFGGKR